MTPLSVENNGHTLCIAGHVDRSMESDLAKALEAYAAATPPGDLVVDMSGVPFFASSAAKALIGVAQDVQSKGAMLKIRASKPVAQTLNLLGAKSWLNIEITTGPGTSTKAKTKPEPDPVEKAPGPRIHSGSVQDYRPRLNIQQAAQGKPKPLPPTDASGSPASGSGLRPAILAQAKQAEEEDEDMKAARANEGKALIPEGLDIDGPPILYELRVLGSYTFHFVGQNNELTVKLLKHVGGSWILTDYKGTRRVINLAQITHVDILS